MIFVMDGGRAGGDNAGDENMTPGDRQVWTDMNRVEGGLKTRGCQKKSIPGNPLVSIITVALNGEKHLEQTIQSGVCQS